ncbi:MAG: hypothetical protein ABWX94_02310, partial [Candidatus Saccharimonadales bacterium]
LKLLFAVSVLFVTGLFLGAKYFSVSTADAASLALLGVPFSIVYLAGLWRGLIRKVIRKPITIDRSLFFKCVNLLQGSIAEYLLVLLGYITVAGILTKGVIFNLGDQIYATVGDATAGFMWLNYAEPGLSPILSSTDDVNYPVGEVVGGPTFVAYYAIWIPMRILSYLFGPIAGLNLVMFIGFVGAAMAGYWLLKYMTRNVGIAAFAGYAIAFTPYALYKSSGHLAYIFSAVFVFILAAFIALWRRPTIWRGILFAAAIALAFYTDGYYVLLASVMVLACVFGGILYGVLSRYKINDYMLRLKSLLIALGALIVFLAPLGLTQILQGDQVKERLTGARSSISTELISYRSNVIDFLLPSEYHPLTENNVEFRSLFNHKIQRSNNSESMSYVGYVVMALAAFGLAIMGVWVFFRKSLSIQKSDRGLQYFTLIGCVTIVAVPLMLSFMFSPNVMVLGYNIALPGQLFIDYDLNLWRVMSRFFVSLHVILVVFAAMSLYVIYRYIVPRKNNVSRTRKVIAYSIITFSIIFTAYEYYTDIPTRPYSFSKDMPYVYSWLKEQKDIEVIAELPLVDPLDDKTAGYVTSQIIHNKKLINFKDPSDVRLNAALGDQNNQETIDFIESRGADVILIRADACTSYSWGDIIYREKNPDKRGALTCVYRLKDDKVDDAFVVYGKGFTPSPNAPDQSVAVFSAGGKGSMYITGPDLKMSLKSDIKLFAKLGNHTNERLTWSVYQSGKLLKSGAVDSGKESPIELIVDGSKGDLQINVGGKSPIQLGQVTLDEVTATRVR